MRENYQTETVSPTIGQLEVENVLIGPDPTWKSLYKTGGICAFLYIILGIALPGLLFMISPYDTEMGAEALLKFIASNKVWWITLQTLTLGPGILAIVTFLALFVALSKVNKGYAAVGAAVAIVCQLLFVAYYPVLLGLGYISDQYILASGSEISIFISAAESLLAQNKRLIPCMKVLLP
jgi:hypothetical protein